MQMGECRRVWGRGLLKLGNLGILMGSFVEENMGSKGRGGQSMYGWASENTVYLNSEGCVQ